MPRISQFLRERKDLAAISDDWNAAANQFGATLRKIVIKVLLRA